MCCIAAVVLDTYICNIYMYMYIEWCQVCGTNHAVAPKCTSLMEKWDVCVKNTPAAIQSHYIFFPLFFFQLGSIGATSWLVPQTWRHPTYEGPAAPPPCHRYTSVVSCALDPRRGWCLFIFLLWQKKKQCSQLRTRLLEDTYIVRTHSSMRTHIAAWGHSSMRTQQYVDTRSRMRPHILQPEHIQQYEDTYSSMRTHI